MRSKGREKREASGKLEGVYLCSERAQRHMPLFWGGEWHKMRSGRPGNILVVKGRHRKRSSFREL